MSYLVQSDRGKVLDLTSLSILGISDRGSGGKGVIFVEVYFTLNSDTRG
jgi:hypothetical protein